MTATFFYLQDDTGNTRAGCQADSFDQAQDLLFPGWWLSAIDGPLTLQQNRITFTPDFFQAQFSPWTRLQFYLAARDGHRCHMSQAFIFNPARAAGLPAFSIFPCDRAARRDCYDLRAQ